MPKLAIITTHPIQYNAPLFKLLATRNKIDIKVFYTFSQALQQFADPDFQQSIQWDIPLLEGYQWEAVQNKASKPSSKNFFGVKNPSLISKIKKYNPDAILVYGWNHLSHFRVMHRFKGMVPILFRGDSNLIDYHTTSSRGVQRLSKLFKFRLRTVFLRYIYRYIDYALFVGTHNKAYYLHHGLKESHLIFAPHAVDNNHFQDNQERNLPGKAQQWRHELNIPNNELVILFAGKFEPKKNPGILIEAVIQINEELKEKSKENDKLSAISYQLLLVGSGISEPQLRNQAKDHSYIHFLPFQNQSKMPIVYHLADIFCLPSQGPNETWGLALNEAMACSRPAIASDKVGAAIDLIDPGKNGYIFQSGNVDDLVDKISKMNSKSICQHMGHQAQNKIKNWSYSHVCEAIENQLQNITITKKQPSE